MLIRLELATENMEMKGSVLIGTSGAALSTTLTSGVGVAELSTGNDRDRRRGRRGCR